MKVFLIALLALTVSAQPIVTVGNNVTFDGAALTPSLYGYLGIRYADPPGRWKAATAFSGENLVVNATAFGSSCYQEGPRGDEDCLFLNVYTPASATATSKLPVRVWIHGGSYATGSGADYDPSALVLSYPSVIVTINYRLGVFGFFVSQELIEEGNGYVNYGLQDQQLALKWVADNIEYFGGNKDDVTIWGESAGGSSVAFHLVLNASWPYFNKAIMESPGPWNWFTMETAANRTAAVLASQNLPFLALRSIPAGTLFQNLPYFPLGQPVIDAQVREQPLKLFADGEYKKVPIIVGFNEDEGPTIALGSYPAGKNLTEAIVLANQGFGISAQGVVQFAQTYGWPAVFPSPTPAPTSPDYVGFSNFVGDYFIKCGSKAIADITAADGNTYAYHFTRVPPTPAGQTYGSYHTAELDYVFKAIEYYVSTGTTDFTQGDIYLSNNMTDYWWNFQRTADPNPGYVQWPKYSPQAANNSILFDLDIRVANLPTVGNCTTLLPFLQRNPVLFSPNDLPDPTTVLPVTVPTTPTGQTTGGPTGVSGSSILVVNALMVLISLLLI